MANRWSVSVSTFVGAASSLLAFGLCGCGFTPLYAEPGLSGGLSHVAVETPAHSRTGYLLRQQLDDELGRSRGEPARYNLKLDVDERRFARGVRVNNVAGRYEILLNVDYVLTDLTTGKAVLQGRARADVSYDSADAPYAGIAASQDGFQRAASQAAIRIRADLARWLVAHPG